MGRLPAVLLLWLVALPVWAHGLRLFAAAEGQRIDGYAYFSGGGRAAGVAVQLLDKAGKPLKDGVTDGAGRFDFRVPQPGRYRLLADSGDGHLARYKLRVHAPVVPVDAADGALPDPVAQTDIRLLERVVARQIRPLREEIAAYEVRRRWSDVLGGIGYIFGLAGLAFYFMARRGR